MASIASRELRNNTRALLERVERGERITITVGGRPVAVLIPPGGRPSSVPRAVFVDRVLAHQADHDLGDVLRDIAPDTTDDL
jgi:prevent-host-death family protein